MANDNNTANETSTITDSQIELLRTEAGTAGDSEQVALCDRAIDGDDNARSRCAEAIARGQG